MLESVAILAVCDRESPELRPGPFGNGPREGIGMPHWAAMLLIAIWTGQVSRWLLPIGLALLTYLVFRWAEEQLSARFRQECTDFLKSQGYHGYIGVLPEISARAIGHYFGPKHASWRCFWKSGQFSSFALAATFGVTFVFNPKATVGFFDGLFALGPRGLVIALGAWIIACVIPDYLMLGKSRFVIWVLQRADLSVGTLVLIGAMDFLAANWMFLSAFVSVQVVGLEWYMWVTGKLSQGSNFSTVLLGGVGAFFIFLLIEAALLGPDGVLYFTIPLANFFWASMVPSVWLWLFIGSSVATRFIIRHRRGFDLLFHILDIDNHPVRSIGTVASIAVVLITIIVVFFVTLIGL